MNLKTCIQRVLLHYNAIFQKPTTIINMIIIMLFFQHQIFHFFLDAIFYFKKSSNFYSSLQFHSGKKMYFHLIVKMVISYSQQSPLSLHCCFTTVIPSFLLLTIFTITMLIITKKGIGRVPRDPTYFSCKTENVGELRFMFA